MRFFVAVLGATASLAYAAPAAAESATQPDEEAAKAHFLAGSAYYEQANYNDAVKEFLEAHRLSKRADLLYNVSVCYERMNRWDDAIASLRQYLRERPGASDKVVIESRIKNFEKRRDEQRSEESAAAATPPPINAPPATVPPPPHRHVGSLIVGGIGVGLLLAALGTGIAAQIAYNDLDNKCPMKLCDPANQELRDEQAFGRALAITTDIFIAVGAAAVTTGVILFLVERRKPLVHGSLAPRGGLMVRF
jgi:tetratricopeptide (TPR) repeat protein